MKILHISDIHGDLNALNTVRKFCEERKDLEVLVCSGDLLGQCLTEKQANVMGYSFNLITDNVTIDGRKIQNIIDFKEVLDRIKTSCNTPEGIKKAIEDYTGSEQEFNRNAEAQYGALASVFSQFPQTIFAIPGNWDSKAYFDYFGKYNIHEVPRQINGIEFIGYGGDSAVPTTLPPTKRIPYSDIEMYNTLVKQVPEVAVTHVPPIGILDKGEGRKHYGSWANFAYIRNPDESSDLLLCGHVHGAAGAVRPNGLRTLVVNAGSLGEYPDSPSKGSFVEIDYKNAENISAKPYMIAEDGSVCEIKAKEAAA
jgi:Icc-related predicted phosphoesterase